MCFLFKLLIIISNQYNIINFLMYYELYCLLLIGVYNYYIHYNNIMVYILNNTDGNWYDIAYITIYKKHINLYNYK